MQQLIYFLQISPSFRPLSRGLSFNQAMETLIRFIAGFRPLSRGLSFNVT